jgi:hypothetical protein
MNQCDGCRRGLPINKNGNHVGPGGFWAGDVQKCTSDRYEVPVSKELFEVWIDGASAEQLREFIREVRQVNREDGHSDDFAKGFSAGASRCEERIAKLEEEVRCLYATITAFERELVVQDANV